MDTETSKSASIINTYNLLQSIIKNPQSYKHIDITMLKDQGRFTQLDLSEFKIVPMSLNRWKHYADETLPIGWKGLDDLRKKALKALRKSDGGKSGASRGSRHNLQDRLNKATKEAQTYINEIARFSEQYTHLLEICHIHANEDESFKELFYSHLSRYTNHRGALSVI